VLLLTELLAKHCSLLVLKPNGAVVLESMKYLLMQEKVQRVLRLLLTIERAFQGVYLVQ